jgi:hypothetical protein
MPSRILAIVAWLAIQILALGLSAARIPLAITFPAATEQLALALMLAVQIGVASLLFPTLFENWKMTAIAIFTAWPMAQLAAMLADVSDARWIVAEAFVSFCLITMSLWRFVLPGRKTLAASVAALLCLGGPVLLYLRADFSRDSGQIVWQRDAWFGPICGALAQIFPDRPIAFAWLFPAIFLIAAMFIALWQRAIKLKKSNFPAISTGIS